MKVKLIITAMLFYCVSDFAQVQMTNGPELDNNRDIRMNRMLGGDDNSFYSYKIRSKGKGTSFYIEKYDKKTLKSEFSKEVNLEDEKNTKIEDVEYSSGNVYIFRKVFDEAGGKATLFFQTVSSQGVVSEQLKEVVTYQTDHAVFADFDIYPNPSQTKFLIKASHKASKDGEYKTDFICLDGVGIKKTWTKSVNQKLNSGSNAALSSVIGMMTGFNIDFQDAGFVGLYFDDSDNFYYGYTIELKNSTKDERRYRLNIATMESAATSPKNLELTFDDDYWVRDIEFMKNNNEIVVGGYIKDVVERKGRDLTRVGIFSFKINLATNTIASKAINFFDDNMLTALESNPRRSKFFKYKLDYILPVGDATYYVGEQYNETMARNTSMGIPMTTWSYEYMDIIIAKLNKDGKFEWIKNVPLRQAYSLMNFKHIFKVYFAVATEKNLYILNDDHPKNIERYEKADFEPKDLKTIRGIHGTNFVCNTVSLKDGKISRQVIMENKTYCFAPIQETKPSLVPPEDTEIFVKGKDNTIYIYTEDMARDRFATIKFD